MATSKADIIAQLQKEIMPLQGLRNDFFNPAIDAALGPIKQAFPNSHFPLAAVHEFIYEDRENGAVTAGFVSALLAPLLKTGNGAIWICGNRSIFLPALQSFGLAPDKIIFIELQKEKDILWALEEALKCEGLATVVAELSELSFTASRRLQLAVEGSKVTGFILRHNPRALHTTACISRWKISSLASEINDGLPGVGFPRWNVTLLKIRNGLPGNWTVECRGKRLRHIYKIASLPQQQRKKTG